jgi:hypothetical protein
VSGKKNLVSAFGVRSEQEKKMSAYFKQGRFLADIQLPEGLPGILGPLTFSPETAKPLLELAEVLLRGANALSPAEREMIATYVSSPE